MLPLLTLLAQLSLVCAQLVTRVRLEVQPQPNAPPRLTSQPLVQPCVSTVHLVNTAQAEASTRIAVKVTTAQRDQMSPHQTWIMQLWVVSAQSSTTALLVHPSHYFALMVSFRENPVRLIVTSVLPATSAPMENRKNAHSTKSATKLSHSITHSVETAIVVPTPPQI